MYAANKNGHSVKVDRLTQVQNDEKDIKSFKLASDCTDVVSPLRRFAPFHESRRGRKSFLRLPL